MGIAYKIVQHLKAKAVQQLRRQLLKRETGYVGMIVMFYLLKE